MHVEESFVLKPFMLNKVNDKRLFLYLPRKRALTQGYGLALLLSLCYNDFISHCFPHI